jgi:hypothetical protein
MIQFRPRMNQIEWEMEKNPQIWNPSIHLSGPETHLGPAVAESDPVEVWKGDLASRRSPTTTLGLCMWATAKGTAASPLNSGMLTLGWTLPIGEQAHGRHHSFGRSAADRLVCSLSQLRAEKETREKEMTLEF